MLKRALLIIVAMVVALTAPLVAQQSTTDVLTAYNHESLTVDNTAGGVGFSTTILAEPAGIGRQVAMASFRVVCASSSPCSINVTYDGIVPTSSAGFPMDVDETGTLYGTDNIRRFRAIRSGSNSAVLRVTYHYK